MIVKYILNCETNEIYETMKWNMEVIEFCMVLCNVIRLYLDEVIPEGGYT